MRKLLGLFLFLSAVVWADDNLALSLTRKTSSENGNGSIISPKPKGNDESKVPEPGEGKAKIGSLGTYGSPRINEVVVREVLGKDLDTWIKKGLASDPSAIPLEKKIVQKIKDKFGFPFAEWSIIQYFEPDGMELHLTLDVVELKDMSRRMPFDPEPKGSFDDPAGLIKQWVEYEDIALNLVEKQEIEPETEKCAALHCPFGHKHEKLKKYEPIFLAGVKTHAAELVNIMKNEKRPEARAAATYLLAYWTDEKNKVVEACIERLKDPDAVVRNNALRVLGDIAEYHTDVLIPLAPILPALDFPRVSDRSKALYVAYLLSVNSSQVREEILKKSVPTLISLMECKQPDHRELAHNILRKISGKEFPDTDARAWTAWYNKLGQNREISKRK